MMSMRLTLNRSRMTAEYKLRILEEADRCQESGEVGALLRREGLYSSLLSTWRQQREEGSLSGLEPKKRRRKTKPKSPPTKRLAKLERENRKLRERLEQAETIIEVQKKVSDILKSAPQSDESD